jgi:DNA-directed RNA polymerase specialized sigma24 family protein
VIPSTKEQATIREIVVERCDAQARRWKANAGAAYDAVFGKVCENLWLLDHLEKPLEHFVRRTANCEARRFFQKEKEAVCFCVPSAALEDFAADRDSSVLESLVRAETRERLLKVLPNLPSGQREALLVRTGAQVLDTEGADLPKSIRGLARQRGCSPQHLCNLANRAVRQLRKQLR